jgi:DNA-binding transcriptional MocR family regulator
MSDMHRILDAVEDRTAEGIASAVGRLISSGDLKTGERLPTVRVLASELRTSPTTVSLAWRSLAGVGLIETRGRAGSFVSGQERTVKAALSRRQSRVARYPLDLTTSMPDPDLIPDIGPALASAIESVSLTSYLDDPVVPELRELLLAGWPYLAKDLTVVNGALDAVDRIFGSTLTWGERVAVADPSFFSILDLIETHGGQAIPVALDGYGLEPESLRSALLNKPTLLLLQPRSQNPTGASMTYDRAEALAEILEPHPGVTIVEDDHAGDVSMASTISLGRWLPERTIHIKSFSMSHGPDLRLAALSGPPGVMTNLANRRRLGPGWTSRLLQTVLLGLLTSDSAKASVETARQTYGRRRLALAAELDRFNVEWSGRDGLNLWVTVESEREAMLALAAQGVGVAAGLPFNVEGAAKDHIRITCCLIEDDFEGIGRQIASAALGIPSDQLAPRESGEPHDRSEQDDLTSAASWYPGP